MKNDDRFECIGKRQTLANPASKSDRTIRDRRWSAVRVVDEKTKLVTIVVSFPTRNGRIQSCAFPNEHRDNPSKIRKRLLNYDAGLPGDPDEDRNFIETILEAASTRPTLTRTTKPGFKTSKGFVLGPRLLGKAKNSHYWCGEKGELALGRRAGTRKGSDAIYRLAKHSSFMTVAILAMLASAIPKYMKYRPKGGLQSQQFVLSETATFNLVGQSGCGKTLTLRVAASLASHPDRPSKWDFTRRGCEEYLEACNEVGAIFDDIEKHIGGSMPLKDAVGIITQYLPDGRSKQLSTVVEKHGLVPLSWSEFGLSSSPDLVEKLLHRSRTKGEKARLIEMMVPPPEEGGVFDNPPEGIDKIEFGKETAKEIEALLEENFGHLGPEWHELLINEDCWDYIAEQMEWFVNRVAKKATSYVVRQARKYGLLYAVGRLAARKGLIDWPADWPLIAVERCFWNAMETSATEEALIEKARRQLRKVVNGRGQFVDAYCGSGRAPRIESRHYGVFTQYKKEDVFGLLDEALLLIANDNRRVANGLVDLLDKRGHYVRGHGGKGTVQLTIPLRIDGRLVSKPRMWLFRFKRRT
jgi:hypothetical protein